MSNGSESGDDPGDEERFIETMARAPGSATPAGPAKVTFNPRPDALIGTEVLGYRLKGKIGQGGMGIVYEGEQPVIGKRVAVKVLRPEIAENPEQMKRLVAEARAVNAVGHRGIIDVFGYGQLPDGRQCIVMEFLEGESLADALTRHQEAKEVVPLTEAMLILEEILSALGAAHGAGVIHRDLKPSNIFLCRQRDGSRYVKLLDFGIAKLDVHAPAPQTNPSITVGTPSYMSPEQASGGPVSPAMDLYAIGVIAFEMLTGQLPFVGESVVEVLIKHAEEPPRRPSSILMSIPDEVDDLVLRLLEKKPADRYQTAEEVRVDVVRVRKVLSESTVRPSLQERQEATGPSAVVLSENVQLSRSLIDEDLGDTTAKSGFPAVSAPGAEDSHDVSEDVTLPPVAPKREAAKREAPKKHDTSEDETLVPRRRVVPVATPAPAPAKGHRGLILGLAGLALGVIALGVALVRKPDVVVVTEVVPAKPEAPLLERLETLEARLVAAKASADDARLVRVRGYIEKLGKGPLEVEDQKGAERAVAEISSSLK